VLYNGLYEIPIIGEEFL